MKKSTIWIVVAVSIVLLFSLIFVCSCNQQNQLVNDMVSSFDVEDSKFGKKIENAYEKYPNNEQICAIYFYYNAKFYQQKDNQYDKTIDYKIYSQLYLRQLNPDYSGVMSQEITNFAISLFGSKAEWNRQHSYFNSKYKKLTPQNKKQIISWIKNRYDYYESIYGYSVEDKYSQIVFTEASKHFNFLYEEINMLWWEYALNPYPLS